MSHNYNKDPNWKWLTQHVIVPIIVAFIAGGAGTAVIVTIWNAQPATPTPEPTPTNIAVVSSTDTPTPFPTDTKLPRPSPIVTPMPPIYTPTFVPPSPTATQEDFELQVTVPGNLDSGVRIDIQKPGFYVLQYVGNAYSPWSENASEGNRGWATHVQVFKGRPVAWGVTDSGYLGPVSFDFYLGAPGYYLTQDEATIATKSKSVSIGPLSAGDYLILVTVDEQGQYLDNRGQVELALILVSQ